MYRNHFNACAKAASSQFSYEHCEFLYMKGLLRTTMSKDEGRRALDKYTKFVAEYPPFDVARAISRKARMHYSCNLKNDFLRSTGRRTTGPSSVTRLQLKTKNISLRMSLSNVQGAINMSADGLCRNKRCVYHATNEVLVVITAAKHSSWLARSHPRCFFQERRKILP